MQVLLLSGVPGSGKSYFGKWLEETHGYVHLDVEKDGQLTRYHLLDAWNRCFSGLGVEPFVKSLYPLGAHVIVNWGFPPLFLQLVQQFKTAGLVLWWFDADSDAAQRAFVARGGVSIDAFQIQMAAIRAEWAKIESVFRPNIITTLAGDDSRLSCEAIYKVMCCK